MAARLPQWHVVGTHHIEREYTFKDFVSALDFVNRAGAIAEEQGHHPDIYLTWGKARFQIYTHSVQGLTESDFVLGAKIERLFTAPQ
jgi:4a-hydroxytetrahydrobiopterin dehydratase